MSSRLLPDLKPEDTAKLDFAKNKKQLAFCLQCPGCGENFKQEGLKTPRKLTCGHTLCQECCTSLTDDNQCITCPLECDEPTVLSDVGVHTLEVNSMLLRQLGQLLYEAPPPEVPLCGECEEQPASVFCKVCEEYYCETCSESIHEASKIMQKHLTRGAVCPVADKKDDSSLCEQHPHQRLQLWCQTCQVLCCVECKDPVFDGAHAGPEHKIVRLEKAAEQEKEKLANAKQGAVRPRLDLLLESLTRTHQSVVSEVRASEATTRERINAHFDGVINSVALAVEKRKAELLRRLTYHEQLRIRKLNAQRTLLAVAVSEAQDALEDMDKGLTTDPVTCLKSKGPRGERLALVVSQKCQTDPVCGTSLELALDDTLEAQLIRLISRQGDIAGPSRPKLLDTVTNAQYCGVDVSWACKAFPGEVIKEYAVEVARVLPAQSEEKDANNAMARGTASENTPWVEDKFIEVWRGKDRHFSIMDVMQNTTYRVRVRAANHVGWGAYSEPREFQTDSKPVATASARVQLLQTAAQAAPAPAAGPPLPAKAAASPAAAAPAAAPAASSSAAGEKTAKPRNFVYSSDFDDNGIVYYIGTRNGVQNFTNPADQGLIVVSRSSTETGRPKDALSREAVAETSTRAELDAWYMFDLKNRRCTPSHYTIRHDLTKGQYARSWRFEGCNETPPVNWTVLKEHKNESVINAPGASATFAVNASNDYRHFRLIQTDKNASGERSFTVSGFELYGKMYQIRPQK